VSLTVGTRLGPYEILSPLGAGGMGEAYRARDTRLRRDVAVKILARHLADRPELRERFEREARTIASLNHPHICTVHDVGHQDGTDYFVMELLDGETLAQRLRGGALPLSQVLQYGAEIGDALDKAHRKGVTHRDLKPGNIMLTKSGAKLLDFGLAKLGVSATEYSGEQETRDGPITAEGTILGTMNYMAPEQLEGREADARSDIFAFGAVLYEMATGKKAFQGKSQASLIAAIMSSEPPTLSAIQPMTPPALDRIIRKCLRKDPDDRWQSAHDVTDELKWLVESGPQTAAVVRPIPARPSTGRRLGWAGAAVLLLAALAAGARYARPSATPASAPAVRFTVGPPDKGSFPALNTVYGFLGVSPDGTKLAFVATDAGGRSLLWIRGLDATEATPLPGTEGGTSPVWSPDSRYLAFLADGKLKKISVSGGPVQTVAETAIGCCAWSPKGVILFNAFGLGPLFEVSEAGGAATPVTALDAAGEERGHLGPYFLPDGEHYLYLALAATPGHTAIYVGSLSSKDRVRVLSDSSNAVYVSPGYLLFHRNGTLMTQAFDATRLATSGDAVPVAEHLQFNPQTRLASFAASDAGVLAYRTAANASPRSLVWVTRSGTEQVVSAPARGYQQPRLSPDGGRIAAEIAEDGSQIWLYDVGRETLTRLTFQGSDNELPLWSPDDKRVTYYSNQGGGSLNLFRQMADGSGSPERLTTSSTSSHAAMSWSPDERFLAYTDNDAGARDLWILDTQDGKARPFLKTTFTEGGARFSPDGRWIAYVSNESGRGEVYVQAYPGPGGKWQISTDGGLEPVWNRNGRELFYRNGDKIIAVPVSVAAGFSAGKPQVLFERRYASTALPQTAPYYDVSADGQRFLMVKEADQEGTPIDVVVNWLAQLDPRAPRTAP
jgi:Tol biopolymer transport system component